MANSLATQTGGKPIPKHGPAWTFYAFTGLAVLVVVAIVIGFRIAAMAHWF